jgi:hypothetical protein
MAHAPSAVDLPVLDISTVDKAVAKHLVETVSQYGFVYIKNNQAGIPAADIDAMFQTVSLPLVSSLSSCSMVFTVTRLLSVSE